ncbi:unnamed protein product [Protopolystoma xenopodis]|uniref:Uncharacterized protein n=1 Tax=Protopolystoma xenopodis TaxID=117903 RepID=A0A448X9L2_9PLAT|nr:unnamed protein product [Protopolystoma xenopodis]
MGKSDMPVYCLLRLALHCECRRRRIDRVWFKFNRSAIGSGARRPRLDMTAVCCLHVGQPISETTTRRIRMTHTSASCSCTRTPRQPVGLYRYE